MRLQNVRDGRPRDAMAEVLQLALDTTVSPARVLAGHTNDERRDRLHQARTANALCFVGPLQCDQPSGQADRPTNAYYDSDSPNKVNKNDFPAVTPFSFQLESSPDTTLLSLGANE